MRNRKKRCGAMFAAGMILAELYAGLTLQVKGAEETAIVPYAQEETVSGNDAEDTPQPPQENPPNEPPQEGDGSQEDVQKPSKPEIVSQPQNVQVEAGGYASFHVSATGGELTYQWLVNTGDGGGFHEIGGANEELYRVTVFDGSMSGYAYKCRVTNIQQVGGENSGENSGSKSEPPHVDTRAAILKVVYKIVGGARSVWVKSSGRGLMFQGSGAYAKFRGISVDGSRISAGEYNKGGSQTPFTEITLLRSYLETLAEGEHEVEIIWEDGEAETSFHIEAPSSNLPAGASGLGRPGDADVTGSGRAVGTTAAAVDAAKWIAAQEKDETTSSTEEIKKAEKESAQISENATDASVSANTLKPSTGTAADILKKAGVLAEPTTEALTGTQGERRTESIPADIEKNPVRLAAMSKTVNQYAQTISLAVILISVVGIAVGFLVYRRHDLEGKTYDS